MTSGSIYCYLICQNCYIIKGHFRKNILLLHKIIYLPNQTLGKLTKNMGNRDLVDGKIPVPPIEVVGYLSNTSFEDFGKRKVPNLIKNKPLSVNEIQ